jgi:uncharacterized membrane protein
MLLRRVVHDRLLPRSTRVDVRLAAWNSLMPNSVRFDPYPAFVLWLFISIMIQLFLMPLIMMGQNIQSRAADKRAEVDRAIN